MTLGDKNTNIEGESVDVNKTTIGQTGPVSGTVGDTGEYYPITAVHFQNSHDITDTTWTDLTGGGDDVIINTNKFDLTGLSGLKIYLTCDLNAGTDGETVYARIGDEYQETFPDTEVSKADSGYDIKTSTVVDCPIKETVLVGLQAKVTAGTGSVRRSSVYIVGEIA